MTAGKLLAAKRPRLVPILDDKVREVLSPARGEFWVSLRDALADQPSRRTIEDVCAVPEVPAEVGLLRRIDVAFWLFATQRSR